MDRETGKKVIAIATVCDRLSTMRRRQGREGENTESSNWEVKWTDVGL